MAEAENKEVAENENPETDDADADADGEGGEREEQQKGDQPNPPKLRLSHKKLAIIAVCLLTLLGGGGYFMRDYLPDFGSDSSSTAVMPKVYYTLPEMVVNLSSRDKRGQYLKLKVSLEAKDQKVIDALTPIMPRVLDMFQLYLRELRSSDLEGSAGIYRLKEELLRRVNLELHPNRINRVLFNEIIIQ